MIRKSTSIFFLLLCFVCLSANDNGKDLFVKANEAVIAEDYNGAITLYNQILDNNEASPELYSNMGHAYFLKKDYPQAKLYFEKGLKLSPHDGDLKTNMKNVDSYLTSDVSQLDDFFLLSWWNTWKSLLGSGLWALLSFLALGMSLYGLGHYLLKWNRFSEVRTYYLMGVGVILFLLFSLTAKSKYNFETNFQHAILMETIQLKSGPDTRSDDLRELLPGEKMGILDKIGEWHKVALRNKSTGWVQIKNLSLI